MNLSRWTCCVITKEVGKGKVTFTPVTSVDLTPSGSKLLLSAGGHSSKVTDPSLVVVVVFTMATIATFMSTLK